MQIRNEKVLLSQAHTIRIRRKHAKRWELVARFTTLKGFKKKIRKKLLTPNTLFYQNYYLILVIFYNDRV